MKKRIVGIIAIAAAAIVAPGANAEPVFHTTTVLTARIDSASSSAGDTATGGCFFLTDKPFPLATAVNQGIIGDVSATRNPSGLPTGATVTCEIFVNGSPAPLTANAYPGPNGVQAGVNQIEFSAATTDAIGLCERVDFADGSSTGLFCVAATSDTAPPQVVIDLADGVFAGTVDPAVCPVLRGLAGSYTVGPFGSGILIRSDGDVDVIVTDQNLVYDCPPY